MPDAHAGPALPAARLSAWLQRHWWRKRPSAVALALLPLAALYGLLSRLQRARTAVQTLPVPVLVVGNLVVGGAGKTPTVIALVQALRAAGWHPGVISRGYGRDTAAPLLPQQVQAHSTAAEVGDEPLLIHRRTAAPVWVGADRVAAARALLAAHPAVDLLLSDDGLQHSALPRCAEVLVFDERGSGNGLLLPAGPLRERCPQRLPRQRLVLYTAGAASTPLPGSCARRQLGPAVPLQAWWAGQQAAAVSLPELAGRLSTAPVPALALAGLAAPQKFFDSLHAAGLPFTPWPQPDHARYAHPPWPAGHQGTVLTTEKDAVKLPPQTLDRTPGVAVWVLPLDLDLPADFLSALHSLLPRPSTRPAP